jgi:hypothetical protein
MTTARPVLAVVVLILAALIQVGPARAGSLDLAAGATGQIDVGSRDSYTSIIISNRGPAVGRLQIGDTVLEIPANGQVELYDRYGRANRGTGYVSVTNSGSMPLRLVSRYQLQNQMPTP